MGKKVPAGESEWIVGWPVVEERGAAFVGGGENEGIEGNMAWGTPQRSFSPDRA